MVKTPRTRHSKPTKDPVTIDLEPDAVSRVRAETEGAETAQQATDHDLPTPPEPDMPENADEKPMNEEPAAKAQTDSAFGRNQASQSPVATREARGGALGAGVAGGAVALLLAGGLHVAGLLPLGASGQQDDHAPAIAALEQQIAALKEQVSTLEGAAGGTDVALEGRVAGAEDRLASLDAALDALRADIARFEVQAPDGANTVDLSPLETRVAAVETALRAIEAAEPAQPDLSAFETGVAALREDLAAAREAQQAASTRIEALEQAVARLGERVDEQAEAPATAIIIAASALKAAIDRGVPFTTELDTFASLAPDAAQIEGLRAHAAAGVATRAQLTAESNAAANAMIAAAAPVDPQAGVVDRLWASAMGLVQVRPIGMVEGDGVPEVVARMDAAVAAGDYERAIAEFATLPDAAKAAGTAFMARLQARHDADRLVDEALATALRA